MIWRKRRSISERSAVIDKIDMYKTASLIRSRNRIQTENISTKNIPRMGLNSPFSYFMKYAEKKNVNSKHLFQRNDVQIISN